MQTGLVYNCPVAPGECGGVRGNSSIYINDQASYENNASIGSTQITINSLPQSFVEGRLFDQARKSFCIESVNIVYYLLQ